MVFRADAAFAKPEIYAALEERGVKYAIRLPANASMVRDIAESRRGQGNREVKAGEVSVLEFPRQG